jgi:hypothetical protein
MDKIIFECNDDIDKKINIIRGQTDYDYEKAKEELKKHDYDELNVIRSYFGITISEKKTVPVKSVNQEIYKQIRANLDGAMKDYNNRKGGLGIDYTIR